MFISTCFTRPSEFPVRDRRGPPARDVDHSKPRTLTILSPPKRLLSLVETVAMDPADSVLRDRLTQIRLQRQEAVEYVQSMERQSSLGRRQYDPARLPVLAQRLREVLAAGPIAIQKGYIQLFVTRVVVGSGEISLPGPSIAIAQASMDGLPEPSALVPTFVQRWRAVVDVGENLWGESNKSPITA